MKNLSVLKRNNKATLLFLLNGALLESAFIKIKTLVIAQEILSFCYHKNAYNYNHSSQKYLRVALNPLEMKVVD
jgi:hypothetical protein